MATQPKPFITEEQYLEIESKAECKSEYYNGEMFLMAGSTSDHDTICTNFYRIFGNAFLNKPCFVYSSNMRVRIPTTRLYTYPDASIVCGERQWADNAQTTLLNPTVIIEVLSESTEAYDRGKKFRQYRDIPSLREYILVAQDAIAIDQFIRQQNGEFLLRSYNSIEDTLEIPAIGCSVALRDIYFKTELPG